MREKGKVTLVFEILGRLVWFCLGWRCTTSRQSLSSASRVVSSSIIPILANANSHDFLSPVWLGILYLCMHRDGSYLQPIASRVGCKPGQAPGPHGITTYLPTSIHLPNCTRPNIIAWAHCNRLPPVCVGHLFP